MRTKVGNVHNRHKIPFFEQAVRIIGISDVVIEILDARMIEESRIPEIEEEVLEQGKILVHVVNKIDLLSRGEMPKTDKLSNPILVSTKTRQGIKQLREKIRIFASRFKERAQVHICVIGYPNTGKSSLLNILARHAAAPVSSQPGFTKGIRKIRFSKGILFLDSPGIIPRNENLFSRDQKKHGLLGIKTPESVKDPDLVVNELMKMYPGKLEKNYDVEKIGDVEVLLEEIGKRWGVMKKGAQIDTDRVARRVLKDWHNGKIK